MRYGWINFALASKMESGEFEFQQAAVSLRLRALSSAQVGTNLLQGWEHVSLFVTPQPLSWIGPKGAPSAVSVHHSSFLSASLLFPTPSCLFILYQQYRASVAQCCWLWVQTEQLHNSSSLLSGTCFVNLWLLSHSQHGPSFGLVVVLIKWCHNDWYLDIKRPFYDNTHHRCYLLTEGVNRGEEQNEQFLKQLQLFKTEAQSFLTASVENSGFLMISSSWTSS